MTRWCPSCGTQAEAGFARCPNCGFDLAFPGQGAPGPDGTTVVAPPSGREWEKTVVEPALPQPNDARRARFDRGREFYESVDETRNEPAIWGSTVAGDHAVIEEQQREAPDDAIVMVGGSRRGVTGPLAYVVERAGVRTGKVHLLRTDTTIGRGPDNDIILGDDSVSRRHAKIRLEDGAFVFWDLASANYSYLVGGDGSRTRILEPRKLVDGDKLDLGVARVSFLLVDAGEPIGASSVAGTGGLISYVESGRSSSVAVDDGDPILVGRDAVARIRLRDTKVSRHHVMVAWMGNGWSVRDLGATNPTRLLGSSGSTQAIVGEVRIASGQLLIGDVVMTLFPAGT